jgi:hypothetical protein
MELKASKENPPMGAIILAQLAKKDIKISWGQANTKSTLVKASSYEPLPVLLGI